MYVVGIPIKENSRKITKLLKPVLIIGSACLVAFLPWFNIHSKEIYSADKMFNTATTIELRTLAEEFNQSTDEDTISSVTQWMHRQHTLDCIQNVTA